MINQSAVDALGWEDPVGRELTDRNSRTLPIVGIMKDFHLHSLHQKIQPLYIYFDETSQIRYLSLKIGSENIQGTVEAIRNSMTAFSTEYPFTFRFFDDLFNENYQSEQKLGILFGRAAFLTIFISALGFFGLASYTAQQRTKEFGIRKVLGASVPNIFILLSKEFTRWVLVANLLA